jgi:probable F420-dependent oxidoreductase
VQIGFAAPVSGSWATEENLVRVARRADELGYASLWTFQRLLSPVDGAWGPMYESVQDPIVTLAYLAGHTERIRLGTAVVNAPFYSPIVLAKQLTTLDIVSRGRLDAGLGLGWSDEEYAAAGASKQDRGRRIDEFIEALTTIWTDTVVEHTGRFYTIPRSAVDPKPVQRPRPPILLGGAAPTALRRAGRLADGWISASRADLHAIGHSVATITAAAVEAGRDPTALRFVCRGSVQLRPAGADSRRPLTGSLDEIRSDLPMLAEQGVTEVFLDLNFDPEIGSPRADPAVSMRRAEELLDAFAPGS